MNGDKWGLPLVDILLRLDHGEFFSRRHYNILKHGEFFLLSNYYKYGGVII